MPDSSFSSEYQRTRWIVDDVLAKADLIPSLTAVRYGSQAVTYGALGEAFVRYERVASEHALDGVAALPAAILHCLPDVGMLESPEAVVGAMGEILTWLGRSVPRDDDGHGRGHLRAVS